MTNYIQPKQTPITISHMLYVALQTLNSPQNLIGCYNNTNIVRNMSNYV